MTISWTAPIGDFDSYTLQRQELVIVESSTIFANAVTLDGNNWLPGSTTTFTDSSILPGNTYEYRVAAVKADGVGEYTDWTRSSPVQTSLGDAPQNFRFLDDSTHRHLADRREFWMTWDPMDGADEYEVGVLEHHSGSTDSPATISSCLTPRSSGPHSAAWSCGFAAASMTPCSVALGPTTTAIPPGLPGTRCSSTRS